MKRTTKFLLALVFLFGVNYSAEAQFLNRLKNRIVDEAERVVIDKTAEKAAEKTAGAMDKILSPDINIANIFGEIGNPVDLSQLPEAYRFDYLYSMKMSSEGQELQFDYLLSETEPYLGIKPNLDGDVTLVMDEKNNAIVTISGGQAFAMSMSLESDELDQSDEIEEDTPLGDLESYSITQLPNRVFLGHDCTGYRMENNENAITMYVAQGIQTGFSNMFDRKQANIPPQMESLAKYHENGILMYMEMEGKAGGANKSMTKMECTAFEKRDTTIRTR